MSTSTARIEVVPQIRSNLIFEQIETNFSSPSAEHRQFNLCNSVRQNLNNNIQKKADLHRMALQIPINNC